MGKLQHWTRTVWGLTRYFAHRLGLGPEHPVYPMYGDIVPVLYDIFRWHRRLRVVHPENCPRANPAVFALNHLKWDDPLLAGSVIHMASGRGIDAHFMMRDDFFKDLRIPLIDVDALVESCGAIQISRGAVRLGQMKPFIELLTAERSFAMYPAGTRSRSGVLYEYRGEVAEPGGVAFFVAQAQKRRPGLRIPVVTLTRTMNPVAKRTTMAFGEPLYLPEGAGREEQRALDYALTERMGDLVEMHALHILGGVLYLRCLRGYAGAIALDALAAAVQELVKGLPNRLFDPRLTSATEMELHHAANYLAKSGVLRIERRAILPECAAVLACPPVNDVFRESHPLRFHMNMIIHLVDVCAALESAAEAL